MGKTLDDQDERIVQKSIGFRLRQFQFFRDFPEVKPDKYCRDALDQQIIIECQAKGIDSSKYLKKEEK